jgi:Tn3 transposase DDE domain
MQAVADALSLLADLVMAWNTMNMQVVLDSWNTRRSTTVPPELIGRIAPTSTDGINLRGVFSFPGTFGTEIKRWPNRGETSMSHLVSPPIRIPESVGHSQFE